MFLFNPKLDLIGQQSERLLLLSLNREATRNDYKISLIYALTSQIIVSSVPDTNLFTYSGKWCTDFIGDQIRFCSLLS